MKTLLPNKKQLKHLLSLCHALQPVVRIGQKGLTEPVLTEFDIALTHHELIKIKVSVGDRDERKQMIADLATKHDAHVVQQIGQVAVLFKRNHEKPVIVFPKK